MKGHNIEAVALARLHIITLAPLASSRDVAYRPNHQDKRVKRDASRHQRRRATPIKLCVVIVEIVKTLVLLVSDGQLFLYLYRSWVYGR
jgi:hypothetical protein